MPIEATKEAVLKILSNWFISWTWWLAMILYHISAGKKYTKTLIIINVLLAIYIWPVVAGFVPDTRGDLKFSIVSLSWVWSIYIFKFLSENFWVFLLDLTIYIKKRLWIKK